MNKDHRFMIISYYLQPNGKWEEVTNFRKNLKIKQITTAKVILDFEKRSVVLNTLSPGASFEDTLEVYKRLLGDKLTPYIEDGKGQN